MINDRFKILARDTALFAINCFGSKILMFLLTPLYTNLLSTEEYGVADLITATINFIYPVLTLAIADASLRYAMDKKCDKSKVLCNSLMVMMMSIIVLICALPVIMMTKFPLREHFGLFVVTYALFNIHDCLSNFIKGIGNTTLFAIQGIARTLTIIISNIILLVFLGMRVEGYMASIILGYGIPIILIAVFGRIDKYVGSCEIDFKLMREMLEYSIPMIPVLMAWAVNTNLDKYMLIGFVGIGASGIYSVAHKIPAVFENITAIFIQAWQLSAISNYGQADEKTYYTSIYKILNVVCLMMCLVIMLLNKKMSAFLFAKDFYIAWKCVPLLIVSAMFSSMGGFLNSAFRAAKKTKSIFFSSLCGMIINVILNWFLIRRIGMVGAALATAVSFFVVWLCRMIMVQDIVSIEISLPITIVSYCLFWGSAYFATVDIRGINWLLISMMAVIALINYRDIRKALINLKEKRN